MTSLLKPSILVVKRYFMITLSLCLITFLLSINQTHIETIQLMNSNAIHLCIVSLTLMVFGAIVILGWHVFDKRRTFASIIFPITFLCSALFLVLHIVLNSGTALSTQSNPSHISELFWYAARLSVGSGLLSIIIFHHQATLSYRFANLYLIVCSLAFLSISYFIYQLSSYFTDYLHFFLIKMDISRSQKFIFPLKKHFEIALAFVFLLCALMFFFNIQKQKNKATQTYEQDKENEAFYLASVFLLFSQIQLYLFDTPHEILIHFSEILQLIAASILLKLSIDKNFKNPLQHISQENTKLQNENARSLLVQKRLTRAIDTAMDGVIITNADQEIILANPAAAHIFGYQVETLLHQKVDMLIPHQHRAAHPTHMRKFGETGSTRRRMGAYHEEFYISGLHAKGYEFPIDASISVMLENEQKFFTIIFRDVIDRKQAKEREEKYKEELSELSSALQVIREEERKRISRELHDDIGQLLAALRMDLSLTQKEVDKLKQEQNLPQNTSSKIVSTLKSMDQLLLTAIATLRRIATDLRPRALDEGGLFYALQTLQKDFLQRYQITCDVDANENELILNDELSTTVFRLVQESLTNVAKHAEASHVLVQLRRKSYDTPDTPNTQEQNTNPSMYIELIIQDDGCGFEPNEMKKAGSYGIVGMRERVRNLKGELHIQSCAEEGTQIKIQFPLP